MGMNKYGCFMQMYTILPKVLGRPLLMNRFDYFSNFYEYNLNVKAYNDILGKCASNIIATVWTLFYSNMTMPLCIRQGSKRKWLIESVWKNLTGLHKTKS